MRKSDQRRSARRAQRLRRQVARRTKKEADMALIRRLIREALSWRPGAGRVDVAHVRGVAKRLGLSHDDLRKAGISKLMQKKSSPLSEMSALAALIGMR